MPLNRRSTVYTDADAMHNLSLLRQETRKKSCLASVAHAVTQAIGGTELEDGSRTDVQLLRLHAHCGVCTSPTVMLVKPPLGDDMALGVG